MADREKVIKGLQVRIISDTDKGYNTIEIPVNEAENILALLKEQEAVAVYDPGAYCPKCGWMLYPEDHPHHCGNCGQAVKWDE